VLGLEGDSSFSGVEAGTPGVFFISDNIGTSEGFDVYGGGWSHGSSRNRPVSNLFRHILSTIGWQALACLCALLFLLTFLIVDLGCSQLKAVEEDLAVTLCRAFYVIYSHSFSTWCEVL
jgi:hypothetical protein